MNLKRYQPPSNGDLLGWQRSMREAFFEAVGPEDMREVVQKLVARAKDGDLAAVKVLLAYGIGSPQVNVKNAVVIAGERASLPAPPARSLPGTPDRVADMADRAANGRVLFNVKDRKIACD